MALTQNGWPIVGKDRCDQGPFQGVLFPNGILAGPVATIARWQLARYEATVEPLIPGACWGWFVKTIEGSAVKSNHGSATAWDINATRHFMGRPASASMTDRQITACRAIVAQAGGVLRWGGDYRGRPDPMHWEIIGTPAAAAAFARQLEATMTGPEQTAAATAGRDIDPGPGGYTWGGATWTILGRTAILNSLPGQIRELHDELDARVRDVDDELDAVGASLAVVAALVGTLTAAPSEQHPIVAAVRYATAPAVPPPAG